MSNQSLDPIDQFDPMEGPRNQSGTQSGGIGSTSYPEYVISFLSPNVIYTGELRPLRWQISRADGVQCDPPSQATVFIYDAAGNEVDTGLAVSLDPSPPANCQIVGTLWGPTRSGLFKARLAIVETGGQTRIDEQVLFAKP